MPKRLGDELYCSYQKRAKRGRTAYDHVSLGHQSIPLAGFKIKALRDPISQRYYVAEESVKVLAERFQPVEPSTSV